MKQTFISILFLTCACCACSSDNNEGQTTYVEAPSDITIERTGANSVLLKWTDNSNNETGFSILVRKADTSENVEIDKVAANVTEYTITSGLEEGNSYFIGVRAFSESTTSRAIYELYKMAVLADELSVSFTDGVKANTVCLSTEYQLKNIAGQTSVKYGLCWSDEHTPTIGDEKQYGPEADADGKVFQAIPNAVLDYGKSYKVRAFLTTSSGTFYSAETTAALGSETAATTLAWTKLSKSSLPSEIELYETTSTLNGRKFHAWYAKGDLSTGKVEVRVNVPSAAATIDAQAASFNGDCYLMVNGGYFYNGNHTGLAVINSVKSGSVSAVRGSLTTSDSEYNSMYNVTRGAFGVDASGKPNVLWAGTDASGNIYYFDRPLPSVKGENKYGAITSENPTASVSWSPKYALSAGPVLLKDKKVAFDFTETSKGTGYYLSNFEVIPGDIFGTGVKPDRTAVGYTEDGKVIFFICDGRIADSDGATLVELAQIMKGLGCVGAINLDGGGSTGMVVGSEHLNDTSTGNRAVVSTIGFFVKK